MSASLTLDLCLFLSLCVRAHARSYVHPHVYMCPPIDQWARFRCHFLFFLPIVWVLGIEFRSLVLAANAFTPETSQCLPTHFFLNIPFRTWPEWVVSTAHFCSVYCQCHFYQTWTKEEPLMKLLLSRWPWWGPTPTRHVVIGGARHI